VHRQRHFRIVGKQRRGGFRSKASNQQRHLRHCPDSRAINRDRVAITRRKLFGRQNARPPQRRPTYPSNARAPNRSSRRRTSTVRSAPTASDQHRLDRSIATTLRSRRGSAAARKAVSGKEYRFKARQRLATRFSSAKQMAPIPAHCVPDPSRRIPAGALSADRKPTTPRAVGRRPGASNPATASRVRAPHQPCCGNWCAGSGAGQRGHVGERRRSAGPDIQSAQRRGNGGHQLRGLAPHAQGRKHVVVPALPVGVSGA